VTTRTILHVDLDAFFAAVEQRDRPELRGRPVIVGGDPGGRGVVSAASYEARRLGVRSAMSLREAGRRCPDGVFLPVDGRRYQQASRDVMAVLRRYTPQMEPISIDEAFLDVTGSIALFGSGETIAAAIKASVREDVGLTASVGVATTKLVAKIASDLRKPDGLVIVRPEEIHAVLDPLPIRRLFGLGAKTAPKVEALGIRTLGELRLASASQLRPVFGRYTERVQQRAAGIDDRPVLPDRDEQQISAEETFETDIADHARLRAEVVRLADKATARLRARELQAGCVTVKIRRRDFVTYTRQRHCSPPTQETRVVTDIATGLLDAWLAQQPRAALRLLGVGVSELASAAQLELFTVAQSARNRGLDAAVDRIRERFGKVALTRASTLDPPTGTPRPPKP
jgi:DNA polymerase-4